MYFHLKMKIIWDLLKEIGVTKFLEGHFFWSGGVHKSSGKISRKERDVWGEGAQGQGGTQKDQLVPVLLLHDLQASPYQDEGCVAASGQLNACVAHESED